MREIKFRAMAGGVMVYFDLFNITHVATYDKKKHIQRIERPHLFISDACPIMQYTGLKDKNGKDIYEGDIIQCRDMHDENIDYWSTKPPRYAILWNNSNSCTAEYSLKDYHSIDKHFFSPIPLDIISHWEVIGNIYENPELIKEQQ
jgi:uncharacterized phage protein (TIGR01671 family)